MKKTFLLLIAFVSVMTFSSCKKDYSCTAVSPSGDESVFKCENCSKKVVEEYEQSILDAGYTSASCEK